eukprot:13451516-Alexandrium_andersonii.AAC.1
MCIRDSLPRCSLAPLVRRSLRRRGSPLLGSDRNAQARTAVLRGTSERALPSPATSPFGI